LIGTLNPETGPTQFFSWTDTDVSATEWLARRRQFLESFQSGPESAVYLTAREGDTGRLQKPIPQPKVRIQLLQMRLDYFVLRGSGDMMG